MMWSYRDPRAAAIWACHRRTTVSFLLGAIIAAMVNQVWVSVEGKVQNKYFHFGKYFNGTNEIDEIKKIIEIKD